MDRGLTHALAGFDTDDAHTDSFEMTVSTGMVKAVQPSPLE